MQNKKLIYVGLFLLLISNVLGLTNKYNLSNDVFNNLSAAETPLETIQLTNTNILGGLLGILLLVGIYIVIFGLTNHYSNGVTKIAFLIANFLTTIFSIFFILIDLAPDEAFKILFALTVGSLIIVLITRK